MRFRVVSTVDTGLGPKKNPFSVWEMVDGEEVWTLQHIRSKEMGYQYIGGAISIFSASQLLWYLILITLYALPQA